jgi:hypothetical protein
MVTGTPPVCVCGGIDHRTHPNRANIVVVPILLLLLLLLLVLLLLVHQLLTLQQ